MVADLKGNDVSAVAVPVTGLAALAPHGTPVPTPEQGKAAELSLNEAFKPVGLRTQDGGPQWSWEVDGDPIQFYEDGYQIPTGMANVTVTMKLAQTDPWVREIISGKKPDENGFISFDGGGNTNRYALYTEDIFKSGYIRRRIAGLATVQSATEDRHERGAVLGYEVVFSIARHESVGGGHFGEWLIAPSSE